MQASSLGYGPSLLLLQLPFLSVPCTSLRRCRPVLLLLPWWFLIFCLSLAVHASSSSPAPSPSPSSSDSPNYAYNSNNPSTAWSLSDYYNSSDAKSRYLYRDFVICNNFSNSLASLNGDPEHLLYGRCPLTTIFSAHGLLNESLVSFTVCFVLPPNTSNCTSAACYYLSVVARNTKGTNGVVIWTANTETLVSENACLVLGEDSNLKLVDYHDNINGPPEVVWQTNTSGKAVGASLVITFEGNLVLFSDTTDPPYVPIWESFQHPTDTMMVLQVLQKPSNLTFPSMEGDSTNSEAAIDNSGMYTMTIENRGLVLYVRLILGQDPPVPYWMSTVPASSANDIGFAALCWDSLYGLRLVLFAAGSTSPDLQSLALAEIPPDDCSSDGSEFLGIMNIFDPTQLREPTNVTYATFLRLESDGDLHAYTMDTSSWSEFYSLFDHSPCNLPLYCGFYGFCDPQKKDNRCGCPDSFKLTDQSNPANGCDLDLPGAQSLTINVSSLLCSTATSFVTIRDVYYFSLNFTDPLQVNRTSTTADHCQEECRNVCKCTAAFWNESGNNACFLIQGPIGTIQRQGGMVAFIKAANETGTGDVQRPQNSSSRWIVIGSAVAASVFALAMAMLMARIYCLYKRRSSGPNLSELEKERLLLSLLDSHRMPQRFSRKQLQEYTCGFSDFLGGGGFGSVFRGSLPDGTAIAVKQLDADGSHGQGDKEFIAEVSILSRTEHVHLVQLIGFCLEGKDRHLVYEYMENGSLDRWLFKDASAVEEPSKRKQQQVVLSWRQRMAIAVGTSKGMAYLHEECKDKVIHMDLKPQNILLDRHFMPKISDFGISKRMSREQTTAMIMTVMRGTPGYLAPEWLLEFSVTEKCDVYSFGIMLLEMVSGRKMRDVRALKRKLGMRSLAEAVMVDVLDEDLKLQDIIDVKVEEAVRMVEVALLCVRTDPTRRPAMSSVALMLEGKAEVAEAAMDDCEDDEDDDIRESLELAMHKSSRNKTMRSMGRSDGNDDDDRSWTFNERDGVVCSSSNMPSSGVSGTYGSSSSNSSTRIRGRKYFQIDKL